jgi:membrane protein required for colicin V production
MSWNALDWILVLVLLVSIVLSVIKGFLKELLGLGSLVLGFLLGAWFYRPAAGIFKGVVKSENVALFCGFFVVFLGTLLVGSLAIYVAQKLLKFAHIQWVDRLLGAAFGFIRGWVLGAIFFLALTSFDLQSDRVKSSQLAPYFLPGARVIAVVTPYELKARFLIGYGAVQKWWREHS